MQWRSHEGQGACVVKQGKVFCRLLAGLVASLSLALPAFGLETFPDQAKAQQGARGTKNGQ